MSTIEQDVSTVPATGSNGGHAETAQECVNEIRRLRERIPRLLIPISSKETALLQSAASVPPEFVELTAVAVTNENALVRGDAATPAEVRDLMGYADAYDPLADELEALAQFVRHSTTAARNKAGSEALTTYALAQRLAKRPEHAGLAAYVADMRRALGRARKTSPEAAARKAAAQAARAVEKAAKAAARVTRPKPEPETEPATTKQQES
jgi:hypothetical protein